MINLRTFLMVATAAVSLSACSSSDPDMGYLGTRDDIIVNNAGSKQMAEAAIEAEVQPMAEKVQTAVVTEAQDVKPALESEVVTEVQSAPETVSVTSKPMETVMMKSPSSMEETSKVEPAAGTPMMPTSEQGDVPLNARPGECYAKVLIPAITETKAERIQVSEEQKVLERIIPARYETTTERVQVKEARQYWKAGQGPITKKNEVTGEILCLVEEPAEFKTIEKRVLVTPEQPQYKTVPAQFENVTKKEVIKGESWEWRRILCETNLSTNTIMQIQRALNSKGYNLTIDGRVGDATMNAINSYQLKNGLASRGITYETLEHIGVSLTGA